MFVVKLVKAIQCNLSLGMLKKFFSHSIFHDMMAISGKVWINQAHVNIDSNGSLSALKCANPPFLNSCNRLLRHNLFSTNCNIATFVFKMCKVEIAVRLKMYLTSLCLQQTFIVKLSRVYNLYRLFITVKPMWEPLVEFFVCLFSKIFLTLEDLLLSK